MSFYVYLSGEIHTDWREEIQQGADAAGLDHWLGFVERCQTKTK